MHRDVAGAFLPRSERAWARIRSDNTFLLSINTSLEGVMRMLGSISVRRWVSGSNSERVSISSSQNSTRTGEEIPGVQKSTMPPRTEKRPGPSVSSLRSQPQRSSTRHSSSGFSRCPGVRVMVRRRSSSGGRVYCSAASAQVTTHRQPSSPSSKREHSACRRWCSYSWLLPSVWRREKSRRG